MTADIQRGYWETPILVSLRAKGRKSRLAQGLWDFGEPQDPVDGEFRPFYISRSDEMSSLRLDSAVTMARAIGHPARLRALAMLSSGELCVCQIKEVLELSGFVGIIDCYNDVDSCLEDLS